MPGDRRGRPRRHACAPTGSATTADNRPLGRRWTHAPIKTLGADPMIRDPAQFDALVKQEIETNTKLVKAAGIKVN